MAQVVILIPAYHPAAQLPEWAAALASDARVAQVVVVDDGSGAACQETFNSIGAIPGVRLLRHEVNRGKGAALKTGMAAIAAEFPGAAGVVTADADGQHTLADILRVAGALLETPERLVLGAREFAAGIPARSLFGNRITRFVLGLITGQRLQDTQTGLRGIPARLLPALLRLEASGYDFELDMLIAAGRRGVPIREIPIRTVYEPGNRTSHFNPLLDSMRIYFVFLRFSAVSMLTAVIDNLVFACLFLLGFGMAASQAGARVTAGSFQYFANKRRTFQADVRNRTAMPKYWFTVLATGSASYAIIHALHHGFGVAVLPAKLLAETVLFFVSFVVLRDWVYHVRREPPARPPASIPPGSS
ncbi:MAG: bifunctional glycosyltransferase family 2/GtrA family protein [Candidatus Solibacter usitatus]|nr:bifunctional glycosyltransferase family 2/GtrA family protein [Candidatus Solibacter usitatus]